MAELSQSIGVVVIGRNEGERLIRCLQSLRPQRVSVVYVDSASTDASVASAEKLGARVLQLDMARPFTAARARAEGFDSLASEFPKLEYVMFVDGDCEVEPDWLPTATRFMDANPQHAAVCGRRRERFPNASLYNALADLEWNTPVGNADACGGDSVVRVGAYRAVGGFDAAIIAGEEPELCSRLRAAGWQVMRLDAPMTIHDAAMTHFGQYWRRAVRSGFGYAQAWHVTRHRAGNTLYARELARAILWAGVLPLAAVAAAIIYGLGAVLIWPLLTGLQFLRLASRDEANRAALATVGKYAELTGVLRYCARMMRGDAGGTIVYK